jgi:hypothetical protein
MQKAREELGRFSTMLSKIHFSHRRQKISKNSTYNFEEKHLKSPTM